MLRMGKRELGMLRMGRSVNPYYENLIDDIARRTPPLPRLGYEDYLDNYRRYLAAEEQVSSHKVTYSSQST